MTPSMEVGSVVRRGAKTASDDARGFPANTRNWKTRSGCRCSSAATRDWSLPMPDEALLLNWRGKCRNRCSNLAPRPSTNCAASITAWFRSAWSAPRAIFAPMVLAEFMRQHPDVKVQLQVGNRDFDDGKTGKHGTGFRHRWHCRRITSKSIKEFVCKHPQIIIAPPSAPTGRPESEIALSQLKSETILLREPGSGTRTVADRLFARNKRAAEFRGSSSAATKPSNRR